MRSELFQISCQVSKGLEFHDSGRFSLRCDDHIFAFHLTHESIQLKLVFQTAVQQTKHPTIFTSKINITSKNKNQKWCK